MIPFPLAAWIKPFSGSGAYCWNRVGTSTANEAYTALNNPGTLTRLSTGTKVTGSYLAKYGGFTWDDTIGYADGDATFWVRTDWTTMLAGTYSQASFHFGNASYNESATDPWGYNDFGGTYIVVGLTAGVDYYQVYYNGSQNGGTAPDYIINPPAGSFAKATWAKIRVKWVTGDGIQVWVNDTLVYSHLGNTSWTFSAATKPCFGAYMTYSIADPWAEFKDVTICGVGNNSVSGAILSLCSWAGTGLASQSSFNDYQPPGTLEQEYRFSNNISDAVYEFYTGGPITYDRTSSTYDRVVPFAPTGSAEIIHQAYEGDAPGDYAQLSWQLLDAQNNVIFTFAAQGDKPSSSYGINATYQVGSDTPVNITNTGSYPQLDQRVRFSGTTISATRESYQTTYVDSWSVNVPNLANATKLRVYNGKIIRSNNGINGFQTYAFVGYWPNGHP